MDVSIVRDSLAIEFWVEKFQLVYYSTTPNNNFGANKEKEEEENGD